MLDHAQGLADIGGGYIDWTPFAGESLKRQMARERFEEGTRIRQQLYQTQNECRHQWDGDPEPSCMICGLMGDPMTKLAFQENKLVRRHLHHVPKEYQAQKLALMGGLVPHGLGWMPHEEFAREMRGCTTWGHVHAVFDRNGCGKNWLASVHILQLPLDFHYLFKPAMRIVYGLGFKMSFLYVARKLADIHGAWNADMVPVKMSLETLVKSEGLWMGVCRQVGIPFKRLTLDDIKVPWVSDPKLLEVTDD